MQNLETGTQGVGEENKQSERGRARENTFLESPNAETGLSSLGKSPVIQDQTEVDAR